jgi:hypothetical protein
MNEIWRPVTDFPNYIVSNLGNLKRTNGKILDYTKNKINGSGQRVFLYNDDKAGHKNINILVATAFVENPNNFLFVKYIDGDNTNNQANNLIWVKSNRSIVSSNSSNVLKE